jgi:hypothetical protein
MDRRWCVLAFACLPSIGCIHTTVDRFTVDKVVTRGMRVPDLGEACGLGQSLVHPIGALSGDKSHEALVIAELTAAVCAETLAWEDELAIARARHNLAGDARIAEINDATVRSQRHHTETAARFWRAFGHLEARFGELGGAKCPHIPKKDESVYLVGLVAGELALFHDRAGGGEVGVPIDTIGKIGRAATCLSDARWWSVPTALTAGAWATIPGSGPSGVDPWAKLDDAAKAGDLSGVRVARGLEVLVLANADRGDALNAAIHAHAASIAATPSDPAWALLDAYALAVTRHQSDLLWSAATGQRATDWRVLPTDTPAPSMVPDVFSNDPFAP